MINVLKCTRTDLRTSEIKKILLEGMQGACFARIAWLDHSNSACSGPANSVDIRTHHLNIQYPYFLLNLSGSAFGSFQVLYKGCVSQEVPASRRETREEGILKLLQLNFELILLFCQLSLYICVYVWIYMCVFSIL